jgi:hypothetical protein
MSEVKERIKDILQTVSDDALDVVLMYLESYQNKNDEGLNLAKYLSKILKEDSELLDRLAQ